MDAGISAIIAASISTVFGGLLGFFSAFLTTRQSQNHEINVSTLPKQMDAAEYVVMILFKGLSNEQITNSEWDTYISKCYWLPKKIREKSLAVLINRESIASFASAHEEMILFFDRLVRGV